MCTLKIDVFLLKPLPGMFKSKRTVDEILESSQSVSNSGSNRSTNAFYDAASTEKAGTEGEMSTATFTVLIIDDEPAIIMFVGLILRRNGYQLISAKNGNEGIALAKEHLPDVILCDIMMPAKNGYEVQKELQDDPTTASIPFLFLTAIVDQANISSGMRLGSVDYLIKPLNKDQLVGAIRWALKGPNQPKATNEIRYLVSSGFSDIPEFFRNATHNYYPLVNEENYWYYSIAEVDPDVIVTNTSEKDIATIRSFDLSRDLPLICCVAVEKYLEVRQRVSVLGVDAVCITDNGEFSAALNFVLDTTRSSPNRARVFFVVSDDRDLVRQVAAVFAKFGLGVVKEVKLDQLEQLTTVWSPCLIFLDAVSLPNIDATYISSLRFKQVLAPIVFYAEKQIDEIVQFLYRLRIVEYLLFPFDSELLKTSVLKFTRLPTPSPQLESAWEQYLSSVTDLVREIHIRQTEPHIAANMAEFGRLSSGLIHDLRNAVGSIIIYLGDKPELDPALLAIARIISMLIEVIASCRFRGTYTPDANINLVSILQIAIETASIYCPGTVFKFDFRTTDKFAPLIADSVQLEQAITAVLVAIGREQSHVNVVLNEDETGVLNLIVAGEPEENELYDTLSRVLMEFVERVTIRHLCSIEKYTHDFEPGVPKNLLQLPVTFSFKLRHFPNTKDFRLLIAEFAAKERDLQSEKAMLPKLVGSTELASLIGVPLTELVSAIKLLQRSIGNLKDPIIQSRLGYALLLCENFKTLIEHSTVIPKPIFISPIILNTLDLKQDLLSDSDVVLHMEADLPPINADELSLLQIFVNLITNAAESMNGEGTIEIQAFKTDTNVVVSIRDNGRGIDQEHLSRIFDLDFTTKRGYDRGVGLFIVSTLIKQLSAEITVSSTVNRGTTFTLRFPRNDRV